MGSTNDQPPTSAPVFGDVLRQLRRDADLTQEALAERAGVSRRLVSDLERGIIRAPHRDTVERLGAALRLDADALRRFLAAARRRPGSGPRRVEGQEADPAGHLPPPLIGRRTEMARVEQHLARAHVAQPSVLVVAGDPGIGKSRLLHEAARRARTLGWQALAGGCTRRSGQEPFAPFAETLERAISVLPMARQRQVLRGCEWLVRLLPELVTRSLVAAPAWTLPPDQERRLLFAAVRRLLANLAGPAGTLLLLDDVQWAGADALDLLSGLVGQPATAPMPPVRAICAYRSTEVVPSDLLTRLLADLASGGTLSQLPLTPLPEEDAADLLDQLLAGEMRDNPDALAERAPGLLVTDDVRAEVLRRADGVPFYLVSTVRELSAGHDSGGGDVHPWQAPWTVAQSIRARVSLLPERARELLGAAAVVGRVIPSAVLMALMARSGDPADEEVVLVALEATCAAGLLVEQASDYQFTHDLIREVTLANLSAARARLLHRRVAEALAGLADGLRERHLAEIAQHYLDAGDAAAALPYAIWAGNHAASVFAQEEAERLYSLAVDLALAQGDRAREVEALEKLGDCLTSTSRYLEAQAAFERACAVVGLLGNRDGLWRLTAKVSNAYYLRGLPEEGLARLQPIVDSREYQTTCGAVPLDDCETGVSARSLSTVQKELATVLYATGRSDLAAPLFKQAIAVATTVGNTATRTQALLSYQLLVATLSDIDEGIRVTRELIPQAEAARDPLSLSYGLGIGAWLYQQRGDLATARAHFTRSVEISEQVNSSDALTLALYKRGMYAMLEGRWTYAHSDFERALAVSRHAEPSWLTPVVRYGMAYLSLVTGEFVMAQRYFDEICELSRGATDGRVMALLIQAHCTFAERDLLAGESQATLRQLLDFRDRGGMFEGLLLTRMPSTLAWAYLEAHDIEGAQAAINGGADAERCSTTIFGKPERSDLRRVRAMIAMRQERWADAQALLDQAIDEARHIACPYAEAKALYVYGQLHAANGELDRSHEAYARALVILEHLSEQLYRPYVEGALCEVDLASHPSTP